MKFIDLGVAALIAVACIGSLYLFDPNASTQESSALRARTVLLDALTSYVARQGLPWFQSASFRELCTSLGALSNATLSFSARWGSDACSGQPSPGLVQASLNISLGPAPLVLEAWYAERG